ncbi:LptA/OstA family protein [Campylobacter sp.]|uniref:LptA/OstA family protein n=1 Tax=Campylobacter sp. TaxID=205 RepID=UPI0026DB394B|nr:LptA/OstA family protein [Campylobacter sp.]MDO4674404.1 LptA/OstA family protein [Campylobacter sp.]
MADKIEVKALNFYWDENAGKSVLSGAVVVKRDRDILSSDELVIFMDKSRKPVRYEAQKNAKFNIKLKNKNYKGSGDKFIYIVNEDVYEIVGNAFIHELESGKKLYGDRIIVDRKASVYRVQSKDNKPARFVFELK